MKKGLTVLIATLFIVSALFLTGVTIATAEDYELETTLEVVGNGSFDRDLEVQTENGYAGKKLTESYYTRWMGTDGYSNLEYKSALEIFMGNSSEFEDEKITEIAYAQTAFSTNMKQFVCSRNYDSGVAQGFNVKGNSMKSFEIVMEDNFNEIDLEGSINGRAKLMQKVVDPVSRIIYLDEVTRLDGQYTFEWNAYSEKISYPEGCEDWLGCP